MKNKKLNELVNEMNKLNEESSLLMMEISDNMKDYNSDRNKIKSHGYIIDNISTLENRGLIIGFLIVVNIIALLLFPLYWIVLGVTLITELVCIVKNYIDISSEMKRDSYLNKDELKAINDRIESFEKMYDKNLSRCNEIKILVNGLKFTIDSINYVNDNNEVVNIKENNKVLIKK